MPVNNIEIHPNLVILDSVTFTVNFSESNEVSIQNHPLGPCFVCGAARAVLTMKQADQLIQAGVKDLR